MKSLCLDLETASIADAAAYLEPVSAPAHYKDEAKIASYVAEKTAEKTARACLDPDLCRIVALGWMREERDIEPVVFTCENEDREREALTRFWGEVLSPDNRQAQLVTFNGFGFDLPVLMRRSAYLDIPWRWLVVDRYRSPHIDLLQKLTFNGAIQGHSLRFYAKRFGIPIQLPEVQGSDIPQFVQDGAWDLVKRHCRSDVLLTAQIATRLGYWEVKEEAELTYGGQSERPF